MSYLYNIACCLPDFKMAQRDLATYMSALYSISDKDKDKIRIMYERSGIDYRFSCLPDFDPAAKNKLFTDTTSEPGMSDRMNIYFKEAVPLAKRTAEQSKKNEVVTHLISVSCTGMAAPGLDLLLVKALGLNPTLERTSVNFMGCYALFHALKMADHICKSTSNAKVLIVSVELCTLHFQKTYSSDQVAANLLFGDGASACIVSAEKPVNEKYFCINRFYSEIIEKGENDMTWRLSETGFLMTLSAYIPALIEAGIGAITKKALQQLKVQQNAIEHWAIHPGGRRILDNIQKELKLPQHALKDSYKVLKEVGNLSSATLLFVLNQIINSENYNPIQPVFAAGFGPGLTVETMLMNCQV
ncbi:MAG: type III polyketide synthase [Bacteroidia bacterium]|nr:type III polyketide synthase [Bacteroidia bacterium]